MNHTGPTHTGPTHPGPIDPEDLPLYAMHLLTPEEAAPIAEALEDNSTAREDLADIHSALAALAFTAEMEQPSAASRTRLLKQVAQEKRRIQETAAVPDFRREVTAAASVTSIGAYQRGGTRESAPARRSIATKLLPWAGWAIAAGLALTAGVLRRERDDLKSTAASEQARADRTAADAVAAHNVLDALNDQTATRVTLTRQGALLTPTGRTTYSADKGVLIFTASNLEPLGTFKVYELWLIPANGTAPVPAGIFHPDAKGYASLVATDLPKGVEAKAFGITIEDDGGSKTPTLPIVMTGA